MVRAMRRVGLNEPVIEEQSWLRNTVKQVAGIRDVWDFKELHNKKFGEVDATSESLSMDLLEFVHSDCNPITWIEIF